MKSNLNTHYKTNVIYNLLTKFNFKNINEIFKIKSIFLNIGFKNVNQDKKKLVNIITLLKLITNQNPTTTKSKKNNIFLKIKTNSIMGCKITLRRENMFVFLEKFLIFILPNTDTFKLESQNMVNIFNFQIKNILDLVEMKNEFFKFKDLPPIDVSIHTNCKNKKELASLLNAFYINI